MRHSGILHSDLFPSQPNHSRENSLNHQKDNSFHDLIQTSAHNLSFTLHQTSFEIEDHLPTQHSPFQHPSTFLPQSFLSKPIEENNYDLSSIVRTGAQQSQRFQWNNNFGLANSSNISNTATNPLNPNTPSANGLTPDNFTALTFGSHNYWENGFGQDHTSIFDQDLSHNPLSTNNYPNIYNETMNGYQLKPHIPSQGQQLAEAMDEEHSGSVISKSQTIVEENDNFENPSSLFAKPTINNIVVDYEIYQDRIKGQIESKNISTPEKPLPFTNYEKSLFPIANLMNDEGFEPGIPQSLQISSIFGDQFLSDNHFDPYNFISLNPKTPRQKDLLDQSDIIDRVEVDQNFPFNSIREDQIKNLLVQPSQQPSLPTQACICNCKKTRCLKMYCECFSKLGYCGEGCHCHECKNRPEHEDDREKAIKEAKQRNSDAFVPKQITETQQQAEAKRKVISDNMKKGCNCRRTKCLKRYCECFNAGAFCHLLCKCENCENYEGFQQTQKEDNPSDHNLTLIETENTHSQSQILFTQNEQIPLISINNSQVVGFPLTSTLTSQNKNGVSFSDIGLQKISKNHQFSNISKSGHKNSHTHSSLLGFVKEDCNEMDGDQNPSKYLKQQASYQYKSIKNGQSEDSDQVSSSNNSLASSSQSNNRKTKQQRMKGFFASSKKYSKKLIIKPHADNSDEDLNSGSQLSTSEVRQRQTLRIKNRSEACMMRDEDLYLQQQIEDMEKKLKQIEQVKNILAYQQLLQNEQADILSSNIPRRNPENDITTQEITINTSGIPSENMNSFEEKSKELIRQKEELELTLQQEYLNDQSKKISHSLTVSTKINQTIEEGAISEQINPQVMSAEKKKSKKKSKILNTQLSGEKTGIEPANQSMESQTSRIEGSDATSAVNVSSIISSQDMELESNTSSQLEIDSNGNPNKKVNIPSNNLFSRIRQTRQAEITDLTNRFKAVGSSTLFSLAEIASTAKPSDFLFVPTDFTQLLNGPSFSNFPKNKKKNNLSIALNRQKRISNNLTPVHPAPSVP